MTKFRPGQVRDAIVAYLEEVDRPASVGEIEAAVTLQLGASVPSSSVRSSLNLHSDELFERERRGFYALRDARRRVAVPGIHEAPAPYSALFDFKYGKQRLVLADCLQWLETAEENSVHAVVTDPPYGLREYEAAQQIKLRAGRGGVWRIPPTFDGAKRKPLPRFTVLKDEDRSAIETFFTEWGRRLLAVIRPGGHVVIAGNPLLTPYVAVAMERAGFERRGEIVRVVRTFRGGDRPKNAHDEFEDVSTMPRSCYEPWGLYRRPISERTVADNLRKWGTGGLRRLSDESPFLDMVDSGLIRGREREAAPHPNAKPQAFVRQLVRGLLPLGEGVVLDPFAGCATTLGACEALGVEGIGVEVDPIYWKMATEAIPKLAAL